MVAKLIFSRGSAFKLQMLLQPQIQNITCATTPFAYHFLRHIHTAFFANGFNQRTPRNVRNVVTLPEFDLQDSRVPATIITGFLGSGKTTLLNRILTGQNGKRIAVIENEFGEVDIDGSLVADHSSSNEDIIMVNNGCLCCTVRGDLVKMLLELVKQRRDKFDHIVIETTGLAKPGPVIETFCCDELVSRYVKLDGVVTLVDSKHAMKHLNEVKPRFVVNESVEQIAYADRIIINKIDLVTEAELEVLAKKIRHINGMAQITQANYGNVDIDFVLGVGGYDLDRVDLKFGYMSLTVLVINMRLTMDITMGITTVMHMILLCQASALFLREILILTSLMIGLKD